VTGIYTLDALISGNWVFLRDALLHLILPTICLAYPALVTVTRMTRATVLEVLENDYVRTARAKGLNSIRVVFVHALPNAMLPILTIIGLSYGTLLSGSFLVEQVFSWPGLGRYAIRAAQNADYPAIMGVTILIALIFSFVNIAIDMLYGVFDPRIRNQTT
jgi:peptide/nickel transport system permease protein